jgi:hypothetical protein
MPIVEGGELARGPNGKIRYRYLFDVNPIKEEFYAQSAAAVDAFLKAASGEMPIRSSADGVE